MKHSDGRPRVHVRPCPPGWRASMGPHGAPTARFQSPGEALDAQLFKMEGRWRRGAVVILETEQERQHADPIDD